MSNLLSPPVRRSHVGPGVPGKVWEGGVHQSSRLCDVVAGPTPMAPRPLLARAALRYSVLGVAAFSSTPAFAACRRGGRRSVCSVRLRATAENSPTPTPTPPRPGLVRRSRRAVNRAGRGAVGCGSLALPARRRPRSAPCDQSALAVLLGKRSRCTRSRSRVALVSLRSTDAAPGPRARRGGHARGPEALRAPGRGGRGGRAPRAGRRQLDETSLTAQSRAPARAGHCCSPRRR